MTTKPRLLKREDRGKFDSKPETRKTKPKTQRGKTKRIDAQDETSARNDLVKLYSTWENTN